MKTRSLFIGMLLLLVWTAASRAFFEDYLRTTKGFYRSVTVCKEYISGYDRSHRLYESFCRLRE